MIFKTTGQEHNKSHLHVKFQTYQSKHLWEKYVKSLTLEQKKHYSKPQ